MNGSGGPVQTQVSGYSSNVQLTLLVNGAAYPLSQIGPDYIIFRDPSELPASDAEIVMSIDGRENRWSVRLTDGAVPYDRVTTVTDR